MPATNTCSGWHPRSCATVRRTCSRCCLWNVSSPPATWNFINWYPFSKKRGCKGEISCHSWNNFLNKAQCAIFLVVEKEEKKICKSLEVIQTQNHIKNYINILRFKKKMIMFSHYLLKKKRIQYNFRFKINETHVSLHISLKFYSGKFYVLRKIIKRYQFRLEFSIVGCLLFQLYLMNQIFQMLKNLQWHKKS